MTFIKFIRIGYALVRFEAMVHFLVQRFPHLSVFVYLFAFPRRMNTISRKIMMDKNENTKQNKTKQLQIESMKCIPKDSVD